MKKGRPLFVYGTLRAGEYNFSMLEAAMCDEPDVNCTADGDLYFAFPGGYPVARFRKSGSTIKGDLLWCDPEHPRYAATVRMEEGAGYECRKIKVTLEDGTEILAYGFHYPREVDHTLLIRDGDWLRAFHEEDMPDSDDDEIDWDEWEPVEN